MKVIDLVELIYAHTGMRDKPARTDIYRLLITVHKETFQRASFYSLSEAATLTPSSNWTFPLPDDFGDDISVMVLGKNRIFASPIFAFTSKNDYLASVGTRNLSYLNTTYSPTIPYAYYIAVPADLWTNYSDIIEAGKETALSLNIFPPMNTDQYEISIMFYPMPPVSIAGIVDTYESSLMRKYPDYVLYEMLYRCYALLRDFEAVQVYKQLADEKFLEAKANEAREVLSPAKTLHLSHIKFRRKPMPGPAVPQP